MALKNPYSQYQNNSIMTASPEELTLKLYEGCMRFIKESIIFAEEKNIEKAHNSNLRAQAIINEFMNTVDRNYSVGEELFNLYEYMNRRLMEANIKKDVEILNEIYGMATELRDTWQQAMKLAKKGK
ncbi:flagellar export chaperone FliS [Clostridium sp. D2Q-11]|uniref:Flagellar secretion chaperone FliS n=1 Tax=Anaeromonas frigoriresistens TaxID=2683708 RepID=A0A942UV97_9FIRM|nr:flagellar export chaperone FliS [Anaeromonas frigoriresistens]MBS4538135.1 flagellar export chaperone FliS [Anaeromonas frigoriresistens]